MAIEEIKNLGNQTQLRRKLNAIIDILNAGPFAKVGGDSSQDFATKNIVINKISTHSDNIAFSGETGNGRVDGTFSADTVIANHYLPFTGCHVIPKEDHNFKIGELVCIEAVESKDKKQPEWHGRYANKGENGIFGIVFDEYEEPKPIPEVGVSKFYSVACLGDTKVLCNGENGNIEYGDELCASSVPGVVMKFTGEWKDRKQICGKAGRSHTFESDETVLIDTTKE